MKISKQEKIIFAGTGSKIKNPSIIMWNSNTAPRKVGEFLKGYSIYSLAISPNGTHLAAGTRTGLMRVYPLINHQVQPEAKPIFEVFHQGNMAVVGLAFSNDDILISAGMDGNMKFWSTTEGKQLTATIAHKGGVLALRRMGSLVLASIGMDHVLKVWDLDSLEAKFISDPFILPKTYALTSIGYCSLTGLLFHPSRTGEIYIYDVHSNFSKRTLQAHLGDFCAISCGPEFIATGGMEDCTLKIWSHDFAGPIHQIKTDRSIISVGWYGPNELMTVFADGNAQTWKLNKNLSPNHNINGMDLRVCLGLPERIIAWQQAKEAKKWRDTKIEEAKRLMDSSGTEEQRQFATIIHELNTNGFEIEALLVSAEAAHAQQKDLWELECLLALERILGDGREALPTLNALSYLLIKFKEPTMALECFKRILRIDNQYPGISDEIEAIQNNPLIKLSTNDGVRGDLVNPEDFHRELEKFKILNKKFNWETIYHTDQPYFTEISIDKGKLFSTILDAIEKNKANINKGNCKIEKKMIFDGKELREVEWLYFPHHDLSTGIAYTLQVSGSDLETEFIPCAVFDPGLLNLPESLTTEEHNRQVHDCWQKMMNSSQIKSWLTNTNNLVFDAIRSLNEDEKF